MYYNTQVQMILQNEIECSDTSPRIHSLRTAGERTGTIHQSTENPSLDWKVELSSLKQTKWKKKKKRPNVIPETNFESSRRSPFNFQNQRLKANTIIAGTDKWDCYQITKLPHSKGNKCHSEQAAYHMGENYHLTRNQYAEYIRLNTQSTSSTVNK